MSSQFIYALACSGQSGGCVSALAWARAQWGPLNVKNGNWGVPRAERVREHVLKEVSAHDLT